MRSIRLSLILYFLGLLLLALGVASLLVYRSAQSTLHAKEEATAALLQARFAQREADERKQLDDRLLEQAFSLASRLKVDFDWGRLANRQLHLLGALSAMPSPMGHFAAAPWLMQTMVQAPRQRPPQPQPHPFAFEVWRAAVPQIQLTQSEVDLPADRRRLDQYFQVDTNHYHWGGPLRSRSLAGLSFPYPQGFGGNRPLHWETDTFELAPGHPVRRVRIKAANTRTRFIPWMRPGGPGGGPGLSGPGRPPRRNDTPPLYLVIQVAADLSLLDARLDVRRAERDEELGAIREETVSALSRLRNSLIAIAAFTFAAVVLGTCWLVWAGLRPLERLSEAVSQVSPRDFHLPLDPATLPAELRPVTEKLTAALDQLGRAFAREKQAAADISHELRTPLAALLTTCELALRRQRTAEKYREMFADCLASAHYLHQIVERLLTLARLDAGVDRCRSQAVDVSEVADQCAAVVRPLAEAQGLTLTVRHGDEDPAPPRATTDPDKLREVMNNLLHNAIQYNRPSGRIDLTVSRENGHVRFEVSDTGVGIPPESRDRIFERFYRADPSRNTDGMHAGLGLAIVKEYIDVMGGRIEVTSQEGAGTVFRVDLPASA